MLQSAVWSLAIGATLASVAARELNKSQSLFVNKYFVYCVCYLSMIFSPACLYFLWQHTAWETMFYLDGDTMNGVVPGVFACSLVLLGVTGFVVCGLLIKAGNERLAHVLWTSAFTCMFSILTLGYTRFLYAGSMEDWKSGKKYALLDFVQSDVGQDLKLKSMCVLPPFFYAVIHWPADGAGITPADKEQLKTTVRYAYMMETAIVASLVIVGLLLGLVPDNWGYDRLVALFTGQLVIGCLSYVPLCLIRTTTVTKSVKTKATKLASG